MCAKSLMPPCYSLAEIVQHNTPACVSPPPYPALTHTSIPHSSCWVIIRNKVYDVTDFLFVSLAPSPSVSYTL